jgi:acyl CoA:acetate/3-ketoacid CoA transferase
LELREVAPGIDIARDIVPLMDVAPLVGQVTEMPAPCFVG